MRKIAIFVLLVTLAATATIAQETQDEDRMFVLINYVTIKQGMEQAFMATSGGPNNDPDRRKEKVAYWRDAARTAKRALPPLTDVRRVC